MTGLKQFVPVRGPQNTQHNTQQGQTDIQRHPETTRGTVRADLFLPREGKKQMPVDYDRKALVEDIGGTST